MKKTALYNQHTQLNAQMVSFAGFQMPVRYSTIQKETMAVRKKVGIFDVSHMQVIFFEAKDAKQVLDFLNHITARETSSLKLGKIHYNAIINSQGGIEDDILVYHLTNATIAIVVNAVNAAKIIALLNERSKQSDIKIMPATDYALLAVQGKESKSIVLDILPHFSEIKYYENTTIKDFDNAFISRTGYTGADGFEIFCSMAKGVELWENFLHAGAVPCGLAARDILRMEMLYPLYGQELDDKTPPKNCGLGFLIKSKKETIAGDLLYSDNGYFSTGFRLLEAGVPRNGYSIFQDGKPVGVVTSGGFSFTMNTGFGIARIKRGSSANLMVRIRSRDIAIETFQKPQIDIP